MNIHGLKKEKKESSRKITELTQTREGRLKNHNKVRQLRNKISRLNREIKEKRRLASRRKK